MQRQFIQVVPKKNFKISEGVFSGIFFYEELLLLFYNLDKSGLHHITFVDFHSSLNIGTTDMHKYLPTIIHKIFEITNSSFSVK